jgi:ketosteroid isomerase-like protein
MPVMKPEDMTRVWSDAFNRGDVDALIALYEAGATLASPSGPALNGQGAIRGALASFVGGKPRIEATTRKVLIAGDLALTYGNWTLHGRNDDGTPRQLSGQSTEVLRRQADGSWRYIIDDPYST